MKKEELSKRIESLIRISHPYEVRKVDVRIVNKQIHIDIGYNPLHETMRSYADDMVSITIENFMVRNNALCTWHKRRENGHSYTYAMCM